ncbi:MAG TPA: T9SS type A sorting domain-containing protein [Saprospiraceae bacterium]|nr:T9SS type A sorting domain-containing protein [Saprospiraceae bacterium]
MRFLTLVFTVSLFSFHLAFAEGTHEVAPNGAIMINGNTTTDIAALHINHPAYNSFASYTNPDPHSRLYVHIIDPTKECIYLGFSFGHPNVTSPNPQHISYEYRIKDPNGNVVFGPVAINPGDENIVDWSGAFTGPTQLHGAGGYDAILVSSADLNSQGWTGAGDYYVEFQNESGSDFLIDFWDVTVADCAAVPAAEKKGRIWSYNWSFFAINDFGFPNRPFNGAFYVCAPDPDDEHAAFITKIDFNGAGFQPAAFNVAFNSFGTQNTGNVSEDRKSVQDLNTTQSEYSIFLNDPIEICKTAVSGEINLLGVTRCNAEAFCIKITTTKVGQIDLLLDFDGPDDMYTPGTRDIVISHTVTAEEVGIPTCIDWDGLDGLGNPVLENSSTTIPVIISYAQGIYHFPIYDAEFMTEGFMIEAVRPAASIPLLHYDDSNIFQLSGSGEPSVQITGCVNPCHRWTNFNIGANIGFGNLNTINSWWFSQRLIRQDVFFLPTYYACGIEGPTHLCQGGTSSLTSNPQVIPADGTGNEIVSTVWSGPDIIGSNTGSAITIGSGGTYTTEVRWLTGFGDTCQASCDYLVSTDPPLTASIDTLILFGQALHINGETYTEAGLYIQDLTSVNGCDSILTIKVRVLQTTIHYNLNACVSHNNGDGTDMDYSEFTPLYPEPLSCAQVTASILFRDPPADNKHSCTNGVSNSIAMCVSSLDTCTYVPGSERSVVFEVTVTPAQDTAVQLTGLSFFEQAPVTFSWISGNSGPNNFPTKYGIRVLKNGTEIYRNEDISTTNAWTLKSYNFTDDILFVANGPTVFRFELLPYCLVDNGAAVAAWDLDEIKITASCVPFIITPIIQGVVTTEEGRAVKDVEIYRSENPAFQGGDVVLTNEQGQYTFDENVPGQQYYLTGYKNTGFMNGVSTLDLIAIQKHLLGKKKLVSPYQLIAADANKSNSVSVIDIIELRKLILGKYAELPNNTSWRFGTADPNLEGTYPWGFNETIVIEALSQDIHDANFTGVKIGDVNGDAKSNLLGSVVGMRGNQALEFGIEDMDVTTGAPVQINITSRNFIDVAGFQLALQLNGFEIHEVTGGSLDIGNDNIHIAPDGLIYISWNSFTTLSYGNDEILFSIKGTPQHSGRLSNMMNLDNNKLQAEAYTGDELERINLEIDVLKNENPLSENILFPNEPNPFSTTTEIRFQLEKAGWASIRIVDLSGHLLKEIRREFDNGINTVQISNTDLGIKDGVVICQLQSNGFLAVQKMVMIR